MLVVHYAPVREIDEEAHARASNDELATGVLPAFLVHYRRCEEPNPEHTPCLTSGEIGSGTGHSEPDDVLAPGRVETTARDPASDD